MAKTRRRSQQSLVIVASLAVSTEGFAASPHSRFLTRLEQAWGSEDILALLDESIFLYSLTESDARKQEVVSLIEDAAYALRSGDVKHDKEKSEISELLAIDQKFDEAIVQRSTLTEVDQASGSEDILALFDESIFLYANLSENDVRKQEVVSLVEDAAFALRSGDVKHDKENSEISELLAIDQKFDEAIMQRSRLLNGGGDSSGIRLVQEQRLKTIQELSTLMDQVKKLVSSPASQPPLIAKSLPIGGESEQLIEASRPPVASRGSSFYPPSAKISSAVKAAEKDATAPTSFGASCLDNLSTEASAVPQADKKTGDAVPSVVERSELSFATNKTPLVKVKKKDNDMPTFGKGPLFGGQMVAKVQNSDDVVPAVAGTNDLETLTAKTSPSVKKDGAVSAAVGASYLDGLTSKPSSTWNVDKKDRPVAPAFYASYLDNPQTFSPPEVEAKDVVVHESSESAPVKEEPVSTTNTGKKSEKLGDRLKSWLQLGLGGLFAE
jgi:nitrite reductase/ring-hydroxylating ferredoxin subunit